MTSNVESKQIRKSSRATAGKHNKQLDFVYTKDRTSLSNKAFSDSSTSMNTSAYKIRDNLLTTVATTAYTVTTVTVSLNSHVLYN